VWSSGGEGDVLEKCGWNERNTCDRIPEVGYRFLNGVILLFAK
jgi:hypothetical protein